MRTTLLLLLVPAMTLAKPIHKAVSYSLDGKPFEGVLVYDDAVKGARPGLLMVPNVMGISEANLKQADVMAGQRYVLFVADMFGKDAHPKSMEEGSKMAGPVKGDRKVMRARINQALSTFLATGKDVPVDLKKVGAIGFCFGGTSVIELARSGADVRGVVSFHGGLDAAMPTEAKPKARVLALHGAEDPSMTPADVKAFTDDMRRVGADWTLVEFGGAVHSFTDVNAKTPGRALYDEKVARRAYQMMHDFFDEAFAG
jgi:dienelactone hydrolase